jgi:hypothetical protein
MSAAILGGVGYLMRRRNDKDDERDQALTELAHATAILVDANDATRSTVDEMRVESRRQFKDVAGRLAKFERRQASLSEATSVLANVLERHEAWHERNDPRPLRTAGGT